MSGEPDVQYDNVVETAAVLHVFPPDAGMHPEQMPQPVGGPAKSGLKGICLFKRHRSGPVAVGAVPVIGIGHVEVIGVVGRQNHRKSTRGQLVRLIGMLPDKGRGGIGKPWPRHAAISAR